MLVGIHYFQLTVSTINIVVYKFYELIYYIIDKYLPKYVGISCTEIFCLWFNNELRYMLSNNHCSYKHYKINKNKDD